MFSNGENLLSIEIGANPEVKVMDLKDMEGRTVKGLGLVNYNNRLWIFNNNILWYSVQENIYDFSTSDGEVSTSSGFIEYVKNITAIIPYLGSLAIFFKNSSILLSGEYPYTQSDESPGGCASYNALVFHGTELYFYDDTKKGVFSFNQIVTGDKTLGDNIALDIQEELCFIDPVRLNEIIYFYEIDNNLYVNAVAYRKTHLLNMECFKKSLSWWNCDIYAKTHHKTAIYTILKCGFKKIEDDLYIYKQ